MDHTQHQQEFSDWLKHIGEGTEPIYQEHGENAIRIPEDICIGCRPGDEQIALLDAIYGNLNNIQDWDARADYIIERAILTPLNDDVDSINKDITHRYIKNPDGSLPKPVFSHGQLYVALSRVGCKDSIRMMIQNGWKEAIRNAPEGVYTDNVVFHDVFKIKYIT